MKILFLYSMFIIFQSSLSQAKDITVQGRVCNRDQIGIPLAKVSFISQDSKDTISTKTDTTGFYRLQLSLSTDIEDEFKPLSGLKLHQNYPNPFNPNTTIEFELPQNAHVSLNILNILGQIVRTLAVGCYTAGLTQLVWDGKDDSGNSVMSGLYLYEIKTDKFHRTNKLLLLDGNESETSKNSAIHSKTNFLNGYQDNSKDTYFIEVKKPDYYPFQESGFTLTDEDTIVEKNIILTRIEEYYSKLVYPGEDGILVYVPDENGNTILDFSNCGYMGGGVKLPEVDVKVYLEPGEGDDGARIQGAINEVAKLPLDENGFRGAVLLQKGQYDISGYIKISVNGIVLRGEGQDTSGTILYATGKTQRSLIRIEGKDNREEFSHPRLKIIDKYVPVGARSFHVQEHAYLSYYNVGDKVIVRRIGNAAWIHEIGMDNITLRPEDPSHTKQWGPFDLDYDRIITKVEGNCITVDAPIACAIESRWGGGELLKYTDSKRVRQIGIENIRGISYFNKHETDYEDGERYYSDEDHCETFILIDNAVNVWVKNVTALHFIDNCVEIQKGAKWVTVQDSYNLDMVSEISGGRRGAFQINGQLCLVQRCHAETGRHDYSVSSRVCGPNVFLYSTATKAYSNSEAHHRWSTGGLFDNVHANLRVEDRQWLGSGHGWAGANYVFWNCEGSLVCQKPPTAQNYAIGHVGSEAEPNFPGKEKGYWESHGRHVIPESLYLKQLEDRLGPEALTNIGY